MVKTSATVLSINPGIGIHLEAYESLGAHISLALEWRDKERETLTANTNYPCEALDSRWFYNRKQKGTDKLLELMKLKKVGDLGVLNATVDLLAFSGKGRQRSTTYTRSDQNLFDVFGIARRLRPKIVIVYAPASLLQSPDTQRLHTMLDFLRYDSLTREERKKIYAVHSTLVDASAFGVGVSKQYTLIVGVRTDIAQKIGITTDLGVNFLIPRKGEIKGFGECVKNIKPSDAESEFWSIQTRSDAKLFKSIGFLKKEPDEPIVFQPNAREKSEIGLPQSFVSNVARASNAHPLPDPTIYNVVHPRFGRKITLSELRASFGIPSNWRIKASDLDAYSMVANSVPRGLAQAVFKDVALRTLSGSFKIKEESDPHLERVLQAETLLVDEGEGRTYHCPVDLGASYGKKVEGQLPGYKDFVYLFDANEINEDFTVLGAFDPTIGRRPVIGAVKRKVFEKEERRRFIRAIKGVKDKTEKRLTCSTIPITQERIDRYTELGRRFEVSEDGFRVRLWIEENAKEPAHWDTWRSEPIPSATVGWLRDRNSKIPQYAGNKNEAFIELNKKAEGAYYKLATADFVKQRTFLNMRVPRDFRLGGSVFTTLAINQYGNEMPAMGYHQDTGDNNSGLTTISVFDEGSYTGGYFVIPRYQCAFRVGDGDVFVANSREYHGVASLNGKGKRMSVVSYTKTDLAYKQDDARSYPAKSPRPNFRWNQYQIAILVPSDHNPSNGVRTVTFLKDQGVPSERITLFRLNTPSRSERASRRGKSVAKGKGVNQPTSLALDALSDAYDGRIKVSDQDPVNYYEENTPVVFMTHDVDGYLVRVNKQNLIGNDFLLEVVRRGFDACRENNAYLFSWNNSWSVTNGDERDSDGAFGDLEEKLQIGEFHPAPTCVGVVIRKNLKASFDGSETSTLAMGNEHFQKDGRIIRLGHVSDLDAYENVSQFEGETTLPSKVDHIERLSRLPTKVPKRRKTQVLAMGGVPAVGKTTIMREFLNRFGPWETIRIGKTLDAHYNRDQDFYVLGDYSDADETFAGTDRLSMSVQTDAVEFLQSIKPTSKILYEGARLFTKSFFQACEEAKVGFQILEVTASPALLAKRHKLRKDNQSKTFLRTQANKVRNVVRSIEYWRNTVSMPHETGQDTENILAHLSDFFGAVRKTQKGLKKKSVALPRRNYLEKEHRREGFIRWFAWSLRYGDCDPAIWMTNYVNDRFEHNIEQRLWFCWLYGNTYNLPTAWVLMNEFPDYELATKDRIEKWNTKNYKKLRYQVDTRWNKGHLPKMFASYQKFIGTGTQQERFEALCSGTPYQNFETLWETIKSELHKFGRYGTWFYLQHLRHTANLNIEPETLMLNDYSGSRSHRNGLLYALGQERKVGKPLSKLEYADLEYEGKEILLETRARFPELASDIDYFAMETALCAYKKIFRPKRSRYLGYYVDRQADEITTAMGDGWSGIEWEVLWEARQETLDPRLLDRGSKEKEKILVDHFLATGELYRLDWIFSDEPTVAREV